MNDFHAAREIYRPIVRELEQLIKTGQIAAADRDLLLAQRAMPLLRSRGLDVPKWMLEACPEAPAYVAKHFTRKAVSQVAEKAAHVVVEEAGHVAVKQMGKVVEKGFFAGLDIVAKEAMKKAPSSPLPVMLALLGIAAAAGGGYAIYNLFSKKEN